MLGLDAKLWLVFGLLGQALFTARFLVQWIASERRKESVVPVSFWWLSLSGSLVLVLYALSRRDPVFVLSTLVNGFLYARNLLLIYIRRERPGSRRVLFPIALAIGASVLVTSWRGLDPGAIAAPGRIVWLVLGFLGAACWSGRFLIQWYSSERAGRSVMPRSFWYVGLAGAVLLLTYSVARRDPVFILGYLFPPFPYVRNLVLIYRKEGAPRSVLLAQRVWYGRRSRAVAIALFAVLLAGFLTAKVLSSRDPAGDFLRYHRAGRIVLTGNTAHLYDRDPLFDVYDDPALEERQFRYAPAFAVLLAPLGALPVRTAEVLWAWLNAFDFLLVLAVCRWMCRRYGVRAAWMWVPFLLAVRFGWDNLNLGQINPTVVLLATAGVYLAETGRQARGGLLVALGGVIKFTPLLALLVFAVRGRWRSAGWGVAGTLLLGLVLPGAVLSPGTTVDLMRTNLAQQGFLFSDVEQVDVPGESLRAMSYRVLGPMPFRKQGEMLDVPPDLLTEEQALLVYRGAALLLLAWTLVFAWTRRDPLQVPLVWGALLAAGLLVSPETRQPHFLMLALPATAVVMVLARVGLGSTRARVACGLVALTFALAALPSRGILGPLTRWFGAYCAAGAATILLLVAVSLAARLAVADGSPRPGSGRGSRCSPS